MILQIDIQGKTVIEKFDNLMRVNEHFDKQLHGNISSMLSRSTKRHHVEGFLWTKVDPTGKTNEQIEAEGLQNVQELVLQKIVSCLNVFDKKFTQEQIEKLIFELS